MLILNQLPSPSLAGVAPVTAMSDREAMSPMDTIALPGHLVSATLEQIEAPQREYVVAAREALDQMHKQLSVANAKKREKSRSSQAKKKGVKPAQFMVGDYVLYQDVWQHKREKLRTTWCGPAVVSLVVSDWVYEIRNLITAGVRRVHASRQRFYSDRDLNMTKDFLAHVAHNSEGFEVEEILDVRCSEKEKGFDVYIKWLGLQSVENSWEPAQNIIEDVPVIPSLLQEKSV
jgi:hypothetical protein